jgi:hypothetical protein
VTRARPISIGRDDAYIPQGAHGPRQGEQAGSSHPIIVRDKNMHDDRLPFLRKPRVPPMRRPSETQGTPPCARPAQ